VFQNTWACRFPWVEVVIGEDDLVAHVQCKICSNIEGKPKLLAPKFDTLHKHVGRHKAIVLNSSIVVEDCFYCKDVAHAKNEKTYFMWNLESVITLMQLGIHLGTWKKFIQFVTVLHILLHGRPILEYESLRELFLLLKVRNTQLKHWSMHDVVLSKTLSMISKANFVVVGAYEVTIVDAQ
jgi:hypothetical protein